MNRPVLDEFLGKRLKAYDTWLEKQLISHSSRVIPVAASFAPKQWVMPAEQVRDIIHQAETLAVQPCECRTHYQRCTYPREVCLVFNRTAEKLADRGNARPIDRNQALEILVRASQSGLIHLALYMPDHEVYALCSCCTCCCHDLQLVQQHGRRDLMIRSQYTARTCTQTCLLCGSCVDICPFDARGIDGNQLVFKKERCLGCGICATACPADAISMVIAP